MKKLLILILVFVYVRASAQTTSQTTFGPGAWKALVTLPANYDTRTDSVPVIIFVPGATEIGMGYPGLSLYGPHARMLNGWNGGVNIPDYGTIYPIIISLEPYTDFATNGDFIRIVMDTILNRYRIKKNSVLVCGYSAGSFMWKILVTEDATDETPPYGPFTYADYVKAIFDLQGVIPDDNPFWETSPKNFARNKWGGKYLGFWGTADGIRGMGQFTDTMNIAVPGSALLYSTADGHDTTTWKKFYGSPSNEPEKFIIGGILQDGYQWLIRQGDTTLYQPPVFIRPRKQYMTKRIKLKN